MWHTAGHDRAVNILKRSLQTGRVSHAYLLAGPPHVGKMTLAMDLARALNCTDEQAPCGECTQCTRISRGLHADVKVVERGSGPSAEGRGRVFIVIDQVREAQREASLKPFEGSYRVFIFNHCEYLTEEAANSLLKTLEEPPDQVVLLLLTSNPGALLPTMTSRCQLLELRPVPGPTVARELESRLGTDTATADEIARLSQGRLGWAIAAASGPEVIEALDGKRAELDRIARHGVEERFAYAAGLASTFGRNRDAGRQELDVWMDFWRDVMLVKEGAPEFVAHRSGLGSLESVAGTLSTAQVARAIHALRRATEHLERNVNPRLALESLMLELPRPG